MHRRTLLAAALPAALIPGGRARAADTLKLAVGQKGNWDTSVAELGQRAGIFRKHDIELDILYTQGSGETLQAVLSRSAEIGVAGGTLGAIGAFAKGAPIRIIASEATGAGDLFWYVRADSPFTSIKETSGKTVAFSTQGSSTNSVVLGFVDTFGIKPELVSTGGIPGTYTQVMSGQIDVGWSAAPYLLDAAEQGKIRIIASGNDVPSMREQTVRVNVAHADRAGQPQARRSALHRGVSRDGAVDVSERGRRESLCRIRRRPRAVRQAIARGVLPEPRDLVGQDHRHRFADGGCRALQVHPGATVEGADRAADPDSVMQSVGPGPGLASRALRA